MLPFILVVIIGSVLGSFSTVLYSRISQNLSLTNPKRSYCDSCKYQLRIRENIPIISYILLKGKCSYCQSEIPKYYILIEIGTTILTLLSNYSSNSLIELLLLLLLSTISLPLILIDLKSQKVPNLITLYFFVFELLIFIIGAIFDLSEFKNIFYSLICGSLISTFYLMLSMLFRGGIGFGDIKLSLPLGMLISYFEWQQAVVAVILAFFVGGVYGVLQMLIFKKGRKHRVPFVPFMLLGAWSSIIFGLDFSKFILSFWGIH